MTTTTTIPLATLPIGDTVVGPVTVSAGLQGGELILDRTVTGGLNSLTNASVLTETWDESFDNGTTWHNLAITHAVGGLIPNKFGGGNQTTAESAISLDGSGPGRQVLLTVNVSGPSSIAVSGTLTTTP